MKKFWRAPVEEEVETELAFHIEMTIHELMEQGMTAKQARTEAERRFGDAKSIDAECRKYGNERDRNARRAEYLDELRQDIAFALRQLIKTPGFTVVAVLTLALGIGATAAMFSALDAVVLRSLPFDHPERVVSVYPTRTGDPGSPSVPEFLAYRRVEQFEHVAATVLQSGFTVKVTGTPELIGGGMVTSDYFAVFAVQPQLGRTFTAEEDTPGRGNVAVISNRLWRSHFNGDRTVVGRVISIDGVPRTVIGVMPASFDVTRNTEDLWVPLGLTAEQATGFGEHFIQVFARLRPTATLAQARAATVAAEREVAGRMPARVAPVTDFGAELHRYMDDFVGDYRAHLLVLLGAVGFVLLIACSNVANLLLARGGARAKELAIRAALGAGRGRLVRQLLTESLVLAVAGATIGLGVAFGLLKLILSVSPEDVPRLEQAHIDWRVLGFTLGLGVASSIIFGLFPALRSAGPRMEGTLREGGRSSHIGRDPLRAALIAAEVALAITLLVGSGLLIRSAWAMQHVDPGFNPRGVLTGRLLLPVVRYPNGEAITRAYASIRDNAAAIPGVKSAALASVVPLSGSNMNSSVLPEGVAPDGKTGTANFRMVSSGYFGTMEIPLITGRDISPRDIALSPSVVVINEVLAKKLWPTATSRAVIGKRLNAVTAKRDEPHYWEVIGVVANLHDEGLNQPSRPEFYIPVAQTPEMIWPILQRSLVVVVRGANEGTPAEALTKPLARAVAAFDSSLPVAETRSMESFLRGSLEMARMNTVLLTTLGAIALVLAMVGIYGVVSYFVNQRTHEIGIRMALGATPREIWRFVVRRGLAPIVVGVVIGLGLSLATTTVIREQLFGITPHDPSTLVAVAATLLGVALLAMYVPARRAMRVPPIVALNET